MENIVLNLSSARPDYFLEDLQVPPEWTPLDEEALKRLRNLEETDLEYKATISGEENSGAATFSSKLFLFIDKLTSGLKKEGMKVEEVFITGTRARQIDSEEGPSVSQGFEDCSDIDVGIRVASFTDVKNASFAICNLLCECCDNSKFAFSDFLSGGLDNYYVNPEGSFAMFTVPTAPVNVDIHIINKTPEDPCFCSANCFQVVYRADGCFIRTVGGYDAQRARQLFQEGKFEVVPPERARHIRNGLFCYCKQLIKGLLPVWDGIEKLFCEGFAQQYPQLDLDGSASFLKAVRAMIAKYDPIKTQAFLFTLEDILSRSGIPEKENYCALLHLLLPDWEEKKKALFLNSLDSDSKEFYDASRPDLPPRYKLSTSRGYLYIEQPRFSLEELLTKNTKMSVQMALARMQGDEEVFAASTLEDAVLKFAQHGMKKEALKLFRIRAAMLYPLGEKRVLCLMNELPDDPYVTLLGYVLKQNWVGYIKAIEMGIEFDTEEQQDLLLLAGAPLQLEGGLVEALLASSDSRWIESGLKLASPETVLHYVAKWGVREEGWTEMIKRKLFANEDPDPCLLKGVLKKMKWDLRFQPLVIKAAKRAIGEGDHLLARQLLSKAKFSFSESLEVGLQVKTSKGLKFCQDLVAKGSAADKEKVALHAVDLECVEEARAFIEKANGADFFEKALKRLLGRKSPGAAKLCDMLLSTAERKKISLAASKIVDSMQQLAVSSLFERACYFFWKRVREFQKLLFPQKLELLHALALDSDIQLLLSAFQEGVFNHSLYLPHLKRGLERRQEQLLSLIGEPLSQEDLPHLHNSGSPGWQKLGLELLSDGDFLAWVGTNTLKKEVRDTAISRFKELCQKSPRECTGAYLKLLPPSRHVYAQKILEVLPLGDPLKQAVLGSLFKQKLEGGKKDGSLWIAIVEIAHAHSLLDPSLRPTVLEGFLNGPILKGAISSALFAAIGNLIKSLDEGAERSRAAALLMDRATDAQLVSESSRYFEEETSLFFGLSGKALLAGIKGWCIDAAGAEKLLEMASEERDPKVKTAFLLYLFDLLSKQPSCPVIERCLELFAEGRRNNLFTGEQIVSCIGSFLAIKLEAPSLHPLADRIFAQAIEVKSSLLESKSTAAFMKMLGDFILRHWALFKNARLASSTLWLQKTFRLAVSNDIWNTLQKNYNASQRNLAKNSKELSWIEPLLESFLESKGPLNPVFHEDLVAEEKAKANMRRFLTFLDLIDDHESFSDPYQFLLFLKIAVIRDLKEPIRWEKEAERVFDRRWTSRGALLVGEINKILPSCIRSLSAEKHYERVYRLFLQAQKAGVFLGPEGKTALQIIMKEMHPECKKMFVQKLANFADQGSLNVKQDLPVLDGERVDNEDESD